MAKLVRLSALGRDVRVGDVYNYFNDDILRSGVQVPNECKFTPERSIIYFYQEPDKFKSSMLGINSHLQNSIKQNIVNLNNLWFANYLKSNPLEEDDMARVDVFIKVVEQTEFLNQHLINSKINEYKHSTGGLATHMVEQVVYGAEFICSMQRKVNQLKNETKESAEENLYRTTKVYFDQIISQNSAITTPPVKFGDEINCKIFSSLLKADDVIEAPFQSSISWLRDATKINKDNRSVPIEIVLRHIPEQIETRLQKETMADMRMDIDRIWYRILQGTNRILKTTTLHLVSPLAKVVYQFNVLLTPLWNKIVATISSPEQFFLNFQSIRDLLRGMTDWLSHRRNETEAICWLLDGTQLVALDFEDIKKRTPKNNEMVAKVFILKVDYIQNLLTERIQKVVGDETSAFNLPMFSISKLRENLHVEIRNKLHEFANEADRSRWSLNRDTSYYIGLVSISSPLVEGSIEIINYFDKVSNPSFALTPTSVTTTNQLHLQNLDCADHFRASVSPTTIIDSFGIPLKLYEQDPEIAMWMDSDAFLSDSNSISDGVSTYNAVASSKVTEFFGKHETNSSLQQMNSEGIIFQSNKIDIIRNTEENLLVKEIEEIRMKDVAETTSSHTSDVVSINSNSTAGTDNRNGSYNTNVGQSNPDFKYYTEIWPSSSQQEEKERTRDRESRFQIIGGTVIDDVNHVRDYGDERNRLRYGKSQLNQTTDATLFLDENEQFSKLIEKDQSTVHLGHAKETLVNENFRCFIDKFLGEPEVNPSMKQVNSDGITTQSNMTAVTRNTERDSFVKEIESIQEEEEKTVQDRESCFEIIGGTVKDDAKVIKDYGDEITLSLLHKESPLNRRIAEIFSDKNGQYSKLIKKDQPNVYLLNAKATSVSEDFRCFDIGQPEGSLSSYGLRNHKVIILMGATGCGKSTLINGMINYILGVQWNDSFRFKCIRDDETIAKNQAHSQTSSVTAYTLHYHEGMTVPYSITIIDTPGYGDTRGVKRDKEITRKIHQFLTQQETPVEEIHAACFVAASSDSRLTATQGYIIDSVLSIFGKDVKENIRLLVTFADSAHPPVVEACLAANFPVTSTSDGITFSKFNSSVLYTSNKKHGDDDFSFDELFWDMGQENFEKFFTMLEGLNGKDLKSTRSVIHRRHLLEQSLKDIERELEICLVNIENIEKFRKKVKEYGHQMESTKNFTFEKTEMRLTKFPCEKAFFAYNCYTCMDTCEGPIKPGITEKILKIKRKCTKQLCSCPGSEHKFEQFEWRLIPIKTTTTLFDMKAKYEWIRNEKLSVEQLLANFSLELNTAKAKVLSLLDQVDKNVCLLESTALRSSALTPSDYLSLMRSRVAEEQAPGYLTRLETLTELQNCLAANALIKTSHVTARSIPNHTDGAFRGQDFWPEGDRSKTSQPFQHSNTDYRMDSKQSAGKADYNYAASIMNTASGFGLDV